MLKCTIIIIIVIYNKNDYNNKWLKLIPYYCLIKIIIIKLKIDLNKSYNYYYILWLLLLLYVCITIERKTKRNVDDRFSTRTLYGRTNRIFFFRVLFHFILITLSSISYYYLFIFLYFIKNYSLLQYVSIGNYLVGKYKLL